MSEKPLHTGFLAEKEGQSHVPLHSEREVIISLSAGGILPSGKIHWSWVRVLGRGCQMP